MKKGYVVILMFSVFLLFGCKEDDGVNLLPVDERVSVAVKSLRDQLTAPENGWLINYQPIPDAGIYYILLKFSENEVTIQSDVPDDNGYFFEQTIHYRIDPQLNIELVFETYAVFHFLFEQDQSTFGAEFEFIFIEEFDGNLLFASKSDRGTEISSFVLQPAAPNADAVFSRELSGNLEPFGSLSPNIFGPQVTQQVYLQSHDISIFWNIDLLKRNITLDAAAKGATVGEVTANNNIVEIEHVSGYVLGDGKLILSQPFSFELSGQSYEFSEIVLTDFTMSGEVFCANEGQSSPVYVGNATGLGPAVVSQSLFSSAGRNFTPVADRPYSVNVVFVADDEGFSLASRGSINDYYPTASGFLFSYGLASDNFPDMPTYSVGITYLDDNNENQFHMREYNAVTVNGNIIQVDLSDNFYFSNIPDTETEQNLRSITDEIFGNGRFYISNVPIEGQDIEVFRLYNPCNGYEFFLVKP